MSELDKAYESQILKMIINKYLDETVSDTSEGLHSLKAHRDQVVWELATKIYSQSGHKVEFSIVRDAVDSRARTIEASLEEAHRAVAEAARLHDWMTRVSGELEGDENKAWISYKVQKIVSEKLRVDESKVNLDSHLSNDLGADGHDLYALVMALEEEFDIEISESEAEDELSIDFPYSTATFWNMSSGSAWSSDGGGGANCIVKNFVNFIYKKVSAQ